MDNHIKDELQQLFERTFSDHINDIQSLPISGSDRRYFRLIGGNHQAIGAYSTDDNENKAFVGFTNHFHSKGVRVPEIYADDLKKSIYLLEDLGDETLLKFLNKERIGAAFPEAVKIKYKKVVQDLAYLQTEGAKGLDYSLCFPTATFDRRSMLWDCNYFKYYFLKLSQLPYNEQLLDEDFRRLTNYLGRCEADFFVYRDFQARNIMLKGDTPYYIDYQGGRQGALQYDLASLLYQAKASLPHDLRAELVEDYMEVASKYTNIEPKSFLRYYYAFVLIRCVQVLGAYGFRGLYERKSHFLTSIPYALDNVEWLLDNNKVRLKLPHLKSILRALTQSEYLKSIGKKSDKADGLTVTVSSFSYRRGIPEDYSGNGGGYVFDCRAIHNPGRYTPYKKLTGRDQPVIDFLLEKSHIQDFLNHAYGVVDKSIDDYLARNFSHLMVSFGCTGGQHRSVYSADQMVRHIKRKYPSVNIKLQHVEQELKNWKN